MFGVNKHTVSLTRQTEYDKETFEVMSEMIKQDPSIPMKFSRQVEYREDVRLQCRRAIHELTLLRLQPRPDSDTDQVSMLGRIYPDFRRLEEHELPEGIQHGATFTCILIDTPHYLTHLLDRFMTAGGTVIRRTLSRVSNALNAGFAVDAVVNCTGLGARSLGGVEDSTVFPTRGQLVIVRAPWVTEGRTRLGKGVYTYTIPRKSGHVVLGGSADANDWDGAIRPELTEQIKRRCLDLHPELLPEDKRRGMRTEDLDVVELACGLRPTRTDGIRLETEMIGERNGAQSRPPAHASPADLGSKKVPLVHNYG